MWLTQDGVPAAETGFAPSLDITLGPDGCLYVCEFVGRVRRIDRDGLIWTVAGRLWDSGYSGDDPSGAAVQCRYVADGLVAELVTPNNGSYIPVRRGRVGRAHRPGNGYIALEREVVGTETRVKATSVTGLVNTTIHRRLAAGGRELETIAPDGTRLVEREALDKSGSATSSTGVQSHWTVKPEPRFGMRVPLLPTLQSSTPGGLITQATFARQVVQDAGGHLSSLADTSTVLPGCSFPRARYPNNTTNSSSRDASSRRLRSMASMPPLFNRLLPTPVKGGLAVEQRSALPRQRESHNAREMARSTATDRNGADLAQANQQGRTLRGRAWG